MPLKKQGAFPFNHSEQQDDLYRVKDSIQIKKDFDSRGEALKTTVNTLIDDLEKAAPGESGAKNIGVSTIEGVVGNDVQTVLQKLKEKDDTASAHLTGLDQSVGQLQRDKADTSYVENLHNGLVDTTQDIQIDINGLNNRLSTVEQKKVQLDESGYLSSNILYDNPNGRTMNEAMDSLYDLEMSVNATGGLKDQLTKKAEKTYVDNQDAAINQSIQNVQSQVTSNLNSINAINAKFAPIDINISKVEQDSIARTNAHINSTSAHKAENIGYSGDVSGGNVKDAIESVNTRVNSIVGQAGTSNTEIVDARRGMDGTNHPVLKNRLDKMEAIQIESSRQTQVLSHGVSVINSTQDSPVDIEIHGRTLIPLASTSLQSGKYYVLTDKKTIIVVDSQRKQGVTKFQKSATATTTTATYFLGNPHKAFITQSGSELMGLNTGLELSGSGNSYSKMSNLDGTTYDHGMQDNGSYVQMRYDFNIIEQIERNMNGRVPGVTTADKAAWLKNNVDMVFNWWGYGQGPYGGNAAVRVWDVASAKWAGTPGHSSTFVRQLSLNSADLGTQVDSNGFAHFLAFGTKATTEMAHLYIDYVELVITLKAGAQLDTRPQIIRIANFQDKVAGSTVENPNVFKWGATSLTSLGSPNGGNFTEENHIKYGEIVSLNNVSANLSRNSNGTIAQQLFSYNLIEEIERNVGKIPKSTVADKVQWLKDNVARLTCNWHGFGSSVGGNSAKVAIFNIINSTYQGTVVHTNGTVTNLKTFTTNPSLYVDNSGFIHFLAYAEPSDGTTASTINTDYVELEIELKPGADIHHPVVPLYEVTQAEYDNILVAWNESEVMNRYPKVQGTQHLQNPAVIAEGENLLPPFYEWEKYLATTLEVKSPYEINLTGRTTWAGVKIEIEAISNQEYFFSVVGNGSAQIDSVDIYGVATVIKGTTSVVLSGTPFKTLPNTRKIRIYLIESSTKELNYKNPLLTLGAVAKPFVPRNPSYLFAQVKLGQIGDKKDILSDKNGDWELIENVQKDEDLTVTSGKSTLAENHATGSIIVIDKSNGNIVTGYTVSGKTITWGTTVPSLPSATYALVSTRKTTINDKVEGRLATNGLTQVEVKSGFSVTTNPDSRKKTYTFTAEKDRFKETVNATDVKIFFDSTLKSVVDTLVEKQADVATNVSINIQAIAELYKRVKVLGG